MERIRLTPRQLELLAPSVRRVTLLRQRAVELEEALQEANQTLIRECELAYPAWTQGCRFIASEGVIEIPTVVAPVVSENTGEYPTNPDTIAP